MVDGSGVAVDLLQGSIAAGVPDGDGPIFTARRQQSPRWIQTNGVHLFTSVREVREHRFVCLECCCYYSVFDKHVYLFKVI